LIERLHSNPDFANKITDMKIDAPPWVMQELSSILGDYIDNHGDVLLDHDSDVSEYAIHPAGLAGAYLVFCLLVAGRLYHYETTTRTERSEDDGVSDLSPTVSDIRWYVSATHIGVRVHGRHQYPPRYQHQLLSCWMG